ncbi:hypothetical protein A2U01_0116069, partial [Trifolium medium]|nr:hypothetical protein [Trifolium medium]
MQKTAYTVLMQMTAGT